MKRKDRIKRDKQILLYREKYQAKTLEEIAGRFKLSIVRIHQILRNGQVGDAK